MSEEDLWIRDLVTTYGAVLVFVSSVIFYFSWRWPKLRGAILRAHLQGFETECAELMTPYKKQLFKDLDEITSKDEILRSLGRIRILEIGVKMGDNIRYYPNEAHLICVDWNRKLSEYLVSDKKSWQFGKVVLERLIIGDGTSLKDVTSGCVDVVVTCRSLCSTSSLPQTLREIRRILARGGKYYFLEHVPDNKDAIVRWLQTILSKTRIWPFLFGDCRLDVNPIDAIEKSGFKDVTWKRIVLDGCVSHNVHFALSRHHVIGTAVR